MPERVEPDGHDRCAYPGCTSPEWRGEERDVRGHAHVYGGQPCHFGCAVRWAAEVEAAGLQAQADADLAGVEERAKQALEEAEREAAKLVGTSHTDSEGVKLLVTSVEPRDPQGRQVRGVIASEGTRDRPFACTLSHFERFWRGDEPRVSTPGGSVA